jgi:hypothetical protein
LRELAELAREDGHLIPDDLVQVIDKGQLLEVGQELQQLISGPSLECYLARIFGDSAIRPSDIHLTLPEIRLRAILTTNYDTLIEDGYSEATGIRPLALTYKDYIGCQRNPIRNNDFFVYKVHGDYRDASTIALGTRSYQDLVHWNPGYRFLLESIFGTYTVLFVGFGGSDPDILHILDSLAARFRSQPARHYILLPHGRWTETEKRRALEDRGLASIEYDPEDNHAQVGAFIGLLARGRLGRRGKVNVVVTSRRADEYALSDLWTALASTGQYEVTRFDLSRTSCAGWFDDLRAQIELSDIVIPVVNGGQDEVHELVESIVKVARRHAIAIVTSQVSALCPFSRGVMVETVDRLWLQRLLGHLEEIRGTIDVEV